MMTEWLSQMSIELCVVKRKKEVGEVSKKADLKRVPAGRGFPGTPELGVHPPICWISIEAP